MHDTQETITKSIRFEKELIEKIEKLAKQNERDFSSQIRFILKEYLNMIERK